MLSVDVSLSKVDDLGPKAMEGVADYLLDGAQKGHSVAMHHVPVDKATLQKNLAAGDPVMANRQGDLRVKWGVTDVPYARDVEFGTPPFEPDESEHEPILSWAERVTGDRDFGWYVIEEKFPEEGQNEQPYIRPGVDAQIEWYNSHGIQDYLDRRLE